MNTHDTTQIEDQLDLYTPLARYVRVTGQQSINPRIHTDRTRLAIQVVN
jgi:hypothetical protein